MRLAGTAPPAAAIRAGLCGGLAAEQADAIVSGFAPESVRLYSDRCGAAVPDVPRLYVKLTEDKEFGIPLQERMIANFAPHEVKALASGHLPMLGKPNELADILESFLKRLETNG